MKNNEFMFPIYRKFDNQYFRLNSNTSLVSVRVDSIVHGVGVSEISEDAFTAVYEYEECNPEEFNTVLDSIMSELLNQQYK